jgi:hypothetical protein
MLKDYYVILHFMNYLAQKVPNMIEVGGKKKKLDDPDLIQEE